jgi:hypothetical protein
VSASGSGHPPRTDKCKLEVPDLTSELRRRAPLWCVALALLTNPTLAAEGPPASPPAQNPAPVIDWHIPVELPNSPDKVDLQQAAIFAWQEFVALNWPAQLQQNGRMVRGQPDPTAKFGQAGTTPLVWETMRQKVEIYSGDDSAGSPPHGALAGDGTSTDPYHYGDPPQYRYSAVADGGHVGACPGQPPVAQAPWVNLDESSQIELDQMYAGIVDQAPRKDGTGNSAPQLVRFLAKANQAEYDYVVREKLWYSGAPWQARINNKERPSPLQAKLDAWRAALRKGTPPNPDTVVTLPPNTIEVKAAWRPLGSGDDRGRFHMATVRYYEMTGPAGKQIPCYRQEEWALVALHIIQKTKMAPYFTFATFEQADNLRRTDGAPIEDDDGTPTPAGKNPPIGKDQLTTPSLSYKDDPNTPTVARKNLFCEQPGRRLYFREIPSEAKNAFPFGTPKGGNICVNQRYETIPADIIKVNSDYHNALKGSNQPDSPWAHYKLVNIQYRPFDSTDINKANAGLESTYFQSNNVVETDYTLQQFVARVASDQAPTRYPVNGTAPDFQNVAVETGQRFTHYQMGGCMGCHGNAQVQGTDFSFILGNNSFDTTPEVPGGDGAKQALFLALFGNPLPATSVPSRR